LVNDDSDDDISIHKVGMNDIGNPTTTTTILCNTRNMGNAGTTTKATTTDTTRSV